MGGSLRLFGVVVEYLFQLQPQRNRRRRSCVQGLGTLGGFGSLAKPGELAGRCEAPALLAQELEVQQWQRIGDGARELCCLDVHLDSAGSTAVVADQDKLELELVLKGSYEDTQTSSLGTASAFRFHYMAALETKLSGRLRSSTSNGWNGDNSTEHLTVPLRPLTIGKEVAMDVPAPHAAGVRLQLKAESCPKELAMHLSFSLCAEELAFLSRRKQVVAKALKQALQLDGDLQEDEVWGTGDVPVVGIMATGGGARAMTSLYGHLLALQKLGLLDCVTYFSGVSGSTW
ncbi:Cytosolic phospholipase A2 delta [Saguinus oedipus]|uniref:Cytosolic phospholipase A2 delta n=1 Tax=Saguinus oedipus TaxID=9490 RepID=A0ABQ9V3Y0_SAGOE|nr:Cytosolic phospholipase A2 delta [Saguinus oedipus]